MEVTIRARVSVTGVAEAFDTRMIDAQKALEDGYTAYPKWVEKSKVERVRNLRCFETVREMLIQGIPTVEVARQVLILGEMKDSPVESVRVYLEHYKATIPKALIVAKINPIGYVEVKKKVDQTVDSIEGMNKLYELMMKRIQIAMLREEGLGFLMNGVEKQFAVAMEILSRMHEMKKDLGVTNDQAAQVLSKAEAVNRVNWDKTYSKPGMNEVMHNPESRTRVIRFLEDMTGIFGKMTSEQQEKVLESAKKKTEGGPPEKEVIRVE